MKEPEAAAKSMEGKDPQMPPLNVLTEQWKETTKLLSTSATKGKAPGTNDEADWKATIDTLVTGGLVPAAKPVETYFNKSFQPS